MINLEDKLKNKTRDERLKLVYEWVKCDVIDFREFKHLVNLIEDT